MKEIESVLIVDFGSQFTQLIARRLRENQVYCEIISYNKVEEAIKKLNPRALILSGGPASVLINETPELPIKIFDSGLPILGICYGMQLMCSQLGGKVIHSESREFGRAKIQAIKSTKLFTNLWTPNDLDDVWMSHGDRVESLPDGFEVFAKSDSSPFAIIGNEKRKFYGVQFHPEVIHTIKGSQLLRNFTHVVSGLSGDWNMTSYKKRTIQSIKNQVQDSNVICGLSGGVDSSVTAVLINEAIGNQLTCVFVDNGLLREGESKEVKNFFTGNYGINLIYVDASNEFLDALFDVEDPEEKRKIIGNKFIEIFEREAKNLSNVKYLAQGTLYPDVIESVSYSGAPSAKIKSHHNVGGLPDRMNLELIEPLRELFKDEVRDLGKELGLSEELINRHPFPGPGLAIRILGSLDVEKLNILRKADKIYLEEIKNAHLYNKIWQAFAVLLPVKSVGVMGDERTYEFVCSLRAVTSVDGMTADFFHFELDFLSNVSTRIVNEVRGINRVVYDVTSKPPGTIEWE